MGVFQKVIVALIVACPSVAQAATVYWSDSFGIHRSNLDGSDQESLIGNEAASLQLDLDAGKMYWSDGASNSILRADLNGKNLETLATDVAGFVVNVSLDTENEFVYWTNPGNGLVQRVSFSGGSPDVVVERDDFAPHYGVAVDSLHDRLFWSKTGALGGGEILRGNLDGSQPQSILPDHIGSPQFLAVDSAAGWLYWSAGGDDIGMGRRFARSRLDGSEAETLIDGQSGRSLVLDLHGQRMLWTADDAIHSANLDGSGIQTLFQTPGGSALGMAVDTTVPGDANGDRVVDLNDFGVVKANFGAGTRRSQGDFNYDHSVDLTDFGILKANFGGNAAAAVPEPSSALLAALAAVAVALVRWGRCRTVAGNQ